jgi:hypothetical protein
VIRKDYVASGASPTGRCSDGRADGQSDAKEIEIQSKINKRNKISFYMFNFIKQRVATVSEVVVVYWGRVIYAFYAFYAGSPL